MTLTIYGRANSSNVQLAMWTVGELGLDHVRHDVGHKHGGTDTPEYRAMNPNGRVPVMVDGDLIMFESGAIARYLIEKHASAPFRPDDLAARAELDVWCEWIKATVAPMWAAPVFWGLMNGQDVTKAAEALMPYFAILDRRLGKGPWLAGEAFTFGDLWTGHLLYRYMTLDFPKAVTPKLDAYYQRLVRRPAFAEHVMVSFDDLRQA